MKKAILIVLIGITAATSAMATTPTIEEQIFDRAILVRNCIKVMDDVGVEQKNEICNSRVDESELSRGLPISRPDSDIE